MSKPLTIVGGGLAGLVLGIGLRQRDVPVTIWEAGHYPRHRVCGEFISGRGQASLARLGLLRGLQETGALSATSAAFFTSGKPPATRPLPDAALCLSRFVLDEWLAREFQRLGGNLRTGSRWTEEFGEGIVRASGRRPQPIVQGWRWFGLKIHARNVRLIADLEMHFVPSGYVGLCRLPGDEVNFCGLFRSQAPVPNLSQRWQDWLGGPANSVLHSRLQEARLDETSFCSVAGLSLSPQRAGEREECCIGDALTMIPPVTGNGMSMAFESAELAMDPLAQFSQGELSWNAAHEQLARSCDHQFAARLRCSALLQAALFHSVGRKILIWLAAHSPSTWRRLFQVTR